MPLFIIGLVLILAAIIGFIVALRMPKEDSYGRRLDGPKRVTRLGAGVALVLAFAAILLSMLYQQDEGEVNVLRSVSGEVVDQDLTPGFGFHAPWVETREFDIRNQMVAYVGDGTQNYNGQPANGPQITTNASDGVRIDFDLAINYSIDAERVTEIYTEYQTQENFRSRFIEQDVRALARQPFSGYTAQEALSARGEITQQIQDILAERWADRGVIISSVALQEIRPPQSVNDSINEAQQARINVERAEANLAAAEVAAQTRVAEATAQAEANRLLSESLSEPVLQQRYLDTLSTLAAGGNLVVVPEGFNGLVNVSGQ